MLGGIAEVDTCGRVRIRKGRERRSTELVATWSPQTVAQFEQALTGPRVHDGLIITGSWREY